MVDPSVEVLKECTWEMLLGSTLSDLAFLKQGNFNPAELVEDNTPEDDEYLEHFKTAPKKVNDKMNNISYHNNTNNTAHS